MLSTTVASINHGRPFVADSDAELLETLLTKVMRLVAMHGEAPVEAHGGIALSMAEGVLLVELLAAGEVTQQQMADRLSLDKSRISRLCSALERKRLLARQRDEGNRRNLRVQITKSGTDVATRLRHTWHERLLAAMTRGERRALLLGLAALARELAAFHRKHENAPGTLVP